MSDEPIMDLASIYFGSMDGGTRKEVEIAKATLLNAIRDLRARAERAEADAAKWLDAFKIEAAARDRADERIAALEAENAALMAAGKELRAKGSFQHEAGRVFSEQPGALAGWMAREGK